MDHTSVAPIQRLAWTDVFAVCVIFALLAVVLYPGLAQVRRERNHNTCIGNLHQIGRAVSLYQADWDEQLPLYDSWANDQNLNHLALEHYGVRHKQLTCPASPSEGKYNNDYTFRFLFDLSRGDKQNYKRRLPQSGAVLVTCPWHLMYGRQFYPVGHRENELFLRLDGSVDCAPRRNIRLWQYDVTTQQWLDPSTPLKDGTRFHYAYPGEPFPPQLADL